MYLQRTSRVHHPLSKGPFQGKSNYTPPPEQCGENSNDNIGPGGPRVDCFREMASAQTFDIVLHRRAHKASLAAAALDSTAQGVAHSQRRRLIAARIKCLPPALHGENNEQLTRWRRG